MCLSSLIEYAPVGVYDVNTFFTAACVGWIEECGNGEDGDEKGKGKSKRIG